MNHIAASSPEAVGTGIFDTSELGDIVWSSSSAIGAPVGWSCTQAGTAGVMVGVTGTVDAVDGMKLTLNRVPGLLKWRYITITIDGTTYTRQSTTEPDGSMAIHVDTALPLGGSGQVNWSQPAFVPIGPIGTNPGVGELAVDVSGGGTITLSAAQAAYEILELTGTPPAGTTVNFPAPASDALGYLRVVCNVTPNAQSVTVGTGAGATVSVPASTTAQIGFDATNGAFGITVATSAGTQTIRTVDFLASGAWTAPVGVACAVLIGFGGGGGGGGGSGGAGTGVLDTYPAGGGGGGGAQLGTAVVNVTPGAVYTVTIGTGGLGGGGGGNNSDGAAGGDGGDTTFADATPATLATFKGATGGNGGSRNAGSAGDYLLAAGGGAPGAYRPASNVSAYADPGRFISSGWNAGGDGIDNQPLAAPRSGGSSAQGYPGGIAIVGGSDSGSFRGGGAGGGGGGGPAGQGGNSTGGGNAQPGADGLPGGDGDAAGPAGNWANTGGGGGGGGGGGSADASHSGGGGGNGGHGGSGKLTIVYVA